MMPIHVMRTQAVTASVYTALNPADKSVNVTLSGANLVATGGSASSGFARSVKAIVGLIYFEAVLTTPPAGTATIAAGVAKSTAANTAALGYSTADGWAFWGTGTGARHNGLTTVVVGAIAGDVFGFAVDQTNGKMWIRKNGVWLGSGSPDPATATLPLWTDLSGATLYAAACPWTSGAVVTMRFDPATFRDAAPSGYSPLTA